MVTPYIEDFNYNYNKLKKVLHLISEEALKDISIDNGEAYVSSVSETPITIYGDEITFNETTPLDERYRFEKQITISITGFKHYSIFNGRYYAFIEDINGIVYLVNVDFPSMVTYSLDMTNGSILTTFNLNSLSNFPTLKVNGVSFADNNECTQYINLHLDNYVYLIDENHVKQMVVDKDVAKINTLSKPPYRYKAFDITLNETSVVDERYRFTKSLSFSVNGYMSHKDLNRRFYAFVRDNNGTYYMLNTDYPSVVTYDYQLTNNSNLTTFTFQAYGNLMVMKLEGYDGHYSDECQPYEFDGIDSLGLINSKSITLANGEMTIYNNNINPVRYVGNITFNESFDGTNVTENLSFYIRMNEYKPSWQYNLLEFKDNTYAAILGLKKRGMTSYNTSNDNGSIIYTWIQLPNETDYVSSASDDSYRELKNSLYVGYKTGLIPSYNGIGSSSASTFDLYNITLSSTTQTDNISYGMFAPIKNNDLEYKYVKGVEINGRYVDAYECVDIGYAKYLVKEQFDANGNSTGNYLVLSGYENLFDGLNIVGTFDDEITFYNGKCDYSNTTYRTTSGSTFCMGCDKYVEIYHQVSYDSGETWQTTATTNSLVERYSEDCGMYRWIEVPIGEDYICDECYEGSETSCKFYVEKRQVSYDNGETWIDTGETRKGSSYGSSEDCQVITKWEQAPITDYICDDCCIYRWIDLDPTVDYICSGTTKMYKQQKQVSCDDGITWENVVPAEYQTGGVYETDSEDCGYVPPTPQYRTISGSPYCRGYYKYVGIEYQVSYDNGETWQTTATTNSLVERNSEDCGFIPYDSEYYEQPMSFTTLEECYFRFDSISSGAVNSIQYSLDNGSTWVTLASGEETPPIAAGTKILWKGNAQCSNYKDIGRFVSSGRFNVEGNIMSLRYGDNYMNKFDCSDYGFRSLFSYAKVVNAENLVLPAMTLSQLCYGDMFYNCTSLITAPVLPASSLNKSCYASMFNGCTSLTTAPQLPAMSLYDCDECYQYMFAGCTSLTTAPDLYVTDILEARNCYQYMFSGCTRLNYVKCLLSRSMTSHTGGWLYNVASAGTFIKTAGVSWPSGVSGIPSGWTVQDNT